MPNIKISDLPPVTLPIDAANTFLEVQTVEAGEEVSRRATADEVAGSGGAPTDATYVTLSLDATLTDERTLAGEAGVVSITDNGAGLTVEVGIDALGIDTGKIAADAVDNTKLADMAQDTIKGRSTGSGTGDPEDLTSAQVVAIISGDLPTSYFTLAATNRVIGSDAGAGNTGDNVFLGMSGAGAANIADNVIAIGTNALNAAAQLDFEGTIVIGQGAAPLIADTRDPWLVIGWQAAANIPGASFHDGNTVIGTEALENSTQSSLQGATLLGHRAGWRLGTSSNANGAVIIGREAAGDGTVQANLICQGVIIGNRACGNITVNGLQQSVVIGDSAGDILNGDIRLVAIGESACGNSSNNDNSVFVGYSTKAGASAAQDSVAVGGQAALADIAEQNVILGSFAANTTGVAAIDRCVFIGQSAGNDLPSVSALFEISSPQGTSSGSIRPFLWGDLDDSNLALLNINDTSTGNEAGTRNLPTWGSAQGVFTMSGSGTDLGATTDADMVHHWIRNSDSALMLRYPGGEDVSILHNGTDSIIGNSAGAMAFSANSVEGLRLTEDNSGVLQVPSASVTVTAFAGGGQGSATALIHSYNVITTVATAGDSVRLPDVFAINALIYIKNDGVNAADVFPASGDNLGAGVDTAVSLAAGDSLTFMATVANSTWTRLISGTGAGSSAEFQELLLSEAPGSHAASPTLRFGDGDTGFFESADDTIQCSTAGVARFAINVFGVLAIDADSWGLFDEAATATNPTLVPSRQDDDTGIGANALDEISVIAGGVEGMRYTEISSGIIQAPNAQLGITAFSGGGQGSATPITSSYAVVTVVAVAGDSVRLPDTFAVNSLVTIKNDDSTDACDVFPASGDDLGAGVDTAESLAAGASITYIATVANSTWTDI